MKPAAPTFRSTRTCRRRRSMPAPTCRSQRAQIGTGFEQGSVFHRQGDPRRPYQVSACADMLMTTSPNVMVYAALDGSRPRCVQSRTRSARRRASPWPGRPAGRRHAARPARPAGGFLDAETSHDLDPLHVVIDVADLGVTGSTPPTGCARTSLDIGLSDHRRIEAALSLADDRSTAARLMSAPDRPDQRGRYLPPAHQVRAAQRRRTRARPAVLPRATYGPHTGSTVRLIVPPGLPVVVARPTQVSLRVPWRRHGRRCLDQGEDRALQGAASRTPAILVARRWARCLSVETGMPDSACRGRFV